ncbi:MAG: hypothetical protein RI907_2126 [Pseudomonadota bacterium]|jgi:phosphatidate cytidylyltransferase
MSFAQSDPLFWGLLAGLLAFLSVATLVGLVLKWRLAPGQPSAAIDNLHQRNLAWWWMIAVCATAFHFGLAGTLTLAVCLSFLALRELTAALAWRDADHRALLTVTYVLLPLQYLWVGLGVAWAVWVFLPLAGMVVLPAVLLLAGVSRGWLDSLVRLQWLAWIGVYAVSHLPALLHLRLPGDAQPLMLLIYFTLVVQLSDVFQFIWGKLIGRRPLAPQVSPGKTVEGVVGGFVSATAVGVMLADITPFEPWQAAGVSLLLCATGLLGGLLMSAVKRERGLKDWGQSIGGHGGVMDRLDSVVLSAPVYYHLVRATWAV